jgi:hypothetical protein
MLFEITNDLYILLKDARLKHEQKMAEMYERRFSKIQEPNKSPKYRDFEEDWEISSNRD